MASSSATAAGGGIKKVTELTIRGLILGVLITLVFTAANVYLGLKVGLTFATSIPAAVISMAVLSAFKDSTILENNIVQTVASAAGTLRAIIFVLPGLVIVGWWTGFPFWTSFWVCAAGGILGVLFTIPLRRAMVTTSDLPYPEGVAAAEVLEVGERAAREAAPAAPRNRAKGLLAVIYGAVASLGLPRSSPRASAAGEVPNIFRFGTHDIGHRLRHGVFAGAVGRGLPGRAFPSAWRCCSGLLIAWGARGADPDAAMIAGRSRACRARTITRSTSGRIRCASSAPAPSPWPRSGRCCGWRDRWWRRRFDTMTRVARQENGRRYARHRHVDPFSIAVITLACLARHRLSAGIVRGRHAARGRHDRRSSSWPCPFIFFGGFLIAAICGYMAGLIGASNSPISGVGILAILICAVLLVAVFQPPEGHAARAGGVRAVHDGGRVRHRLHFEQQPAGPEDRPAGGRDARRASNGR